MATEPATSIADSAPQWASDCPTYKALWLQFSDPESASDINLGSSEEALSTTCPNHKGLLERFNDYVVSEGPCGERFKNNSVVEFQNSHKGSSVNLSQLLSKVWPLRPAWLVEVQKQCIVPGHEPVDYVAISYTYGSHTPPVITSTAFKSLQKPFALASPQFSHFVSPIIRHAMYLTSAIDERYLWADALCVTHHDPGAALEQLRSMGAFYANAAVTVIATDGDSGSGISGLKGTFDPRGLNQNVIPFGDERLILRNTFTIDEMTFFPTQLQTYYQRGWTCQEYAMAKRKIIFYNHEAHWVCSCSLWHEELTLFTEIDFELHPQFKFVMAEFPDDSSLSRYFHEYNQRSLTFEEDALPALFGLLSVFSRSLCWRASGTKGLQRRMASSRPIESRFEYSDLPSWSWLGWKGSIHIRGQTGIRVGSNYTREEEYVEEAFPITEWYTSRLPTDRRERWRRIRPTWFEKREGYKDFTKPMPPGWKRVLAPENEP
ncbi:hypothetical protein FBULB1_4629 [Fusarium bulbicola]|nr:hypothetical protein FBULB1_4629 [Fusarium bulbicola]